MKLSCLLENTSEYRLGKFIQRFGIEAESEKACGSERERQRKLVYKRADKDLKCV